ncbi:hypothetical protein [Variovorax sp. Root473]|uniref:hypothetical protein n=1 Tax=Variovorax sp. Root473 TaxID=1736541 RepID=UPI000AB9BBF7|nr:hypothetical protein [Variovorax sp. Root473]
MARTTRKTKKQPEQLQLDLKGAIGRTKLSPPKSVSEEFSFRDFAQRFYASQQGRRS